MQRDAAPAKSKNPMSAGSRIANLHAQKFRQADEWPVWRVAAQGRGRAPTVAPSRRHTFIAPGGSYRQIEAWLPEGAEQLDFGAAVHHHLQACVLGKFGRVIVVDADLPPQHFRANGNGL